MDLAGFDAEAMIVDVCLDRRRKLWMAKKKVGRKLA